MSTNPDTKQELETYKDAVWDYMLEHCDITENGSYFIKFHTPTRANFERHVKGRWKYNYHRHDDRMDFTHKQKEKDATARREAHTSRKVSKKRKYKLTKEESKKVQTALAEQKRVQSLNPVARFIHKLYMQPVAQTWYNNIKQFYVKIANKKENKEN